MNPLDIKNFRENIMKMSQERFGLLMSVTQTTVTRWEAGSGKPTGDAERKLKQLAVTMSKPEGANEVHHLLGKPGGFGSLSALLALGSISSKTGFALGVSSIFSSAGVLTTPAAYSLYELLDQTLNSK